MREIKSLKDLRSCGSGLFSLLGDMVLERGTCSSVVVHWNLCDIRPDLLRIQLTVAFEMLDRRSRENPSFLRDDLRCSRASGSSAIVSILLGIGDIGDFPPAEPPTSNVTTEVVTTPVMFGSAVLEVASSLG